MLPKGVIEILKVEGLDTEDFLSDFAVEVKNVCQKPIYKITFYIDFLNCFPAAGQNRCGLMLCYSNRIFHKMEPPNEGDKPILPGETVAIKFSPEESKGLREALKEGIVREGLFDKLSIWFQAANFGDGTGYHLINCCDGRWKD